MKTLETEARHLAEENRKSDPSIRKVFWFPDAQEIRLVELTDDIPAALDGELHPFYFRASNGYSATSGIALIRHDEFGKLKLPARWGHWTQAEEI